MQDGHSLAFSFRSLTDSRQSSAQIEKLTLGIMHGYPKLHDYILGQPEVTVATGDHRHLLPIFDKPFYQCSLRLQGTRLSLKPFSLQSSEVESQQEKTSIFD